MKSGIIRRRLRLLSLSFFFPAAGGRARELGAKGSYVGLKGRSLRKNGRPWAAMGLPTTEAIG